MTEADSSPALLKPHRLQSCVTLVRLFPGDCLLHLAYGQVLATFCSQSTLGAVIMQFVVLVGPSIIPGTGTYLLQDLAIRK